MITSIHSFNESIYNNTFIAYHGSPVDIQNFTTEFVGGKDANDQNGPGIYFTSHFDDAAKYGGHVYKVTLSPKRLLDEGPFNIREKPKLLKLLKMAPDWKMDAMDWAQNANVGAQMIVDAAVEYNDEEYNVWLQIWIDAYRHKSSAFVDNMPKIGIDGIKVKGYNINDSDYTHYIIYNPAIITNIEKVKDKDDSNRI